MSANQQRRAKGHGTIVARGDRWALRWRVDGRVVQEITPYRVAVKADRARAEALLEERTEIQRLRRERDRLALMIARAQSVDERIRALQAKSEGRADVLTLGGLEAAWRQSPRRKECRPARLERYAQQLRAFVAWAGSDMDIRAVTDAVAERYAAALARRLSANTYNQHLTLLTAVWRAVGKSRRLANPWEDLPRRRHDTHTRRALTDDELAKIIGAAEGEFKALFMIGAHTGLRLGDACNLRWEDFRDDGVLVVHTHKTGATVTLPGARLRTALAELAGGVGSGLIVPGIARRYATAPTNLSTSIRRQIERSGIATQTREAGWGRARPTVSFHALRHTFVTRAIEAGVPPAIVQALVGHTTAAMTDHYTHVGSAAVLAAFERAGIG